MVIVEALPSAVVLMVSFMLPGIRKYQNNPTSTSLGTKHYPVYNIDFPGVTICPNTKVGYWVLVSNFWNIRCRL